MGKMYDDVASGSATIKVQYATTDIQETYVGCQVGALVGEDINLTGCFADTTGTIEIGNANDEKKSHAYTYTASEDNKAGRTIQGFSQQLEEKLKNGPGAPYPDFEKFRKYYGEVPPLYSCLYCFLLASFVVAIIVV